MSAADLEHARIAVRKAGLAAEQIDNDADRAAAWLGVARELRCIAELGSSETERGDR